MVYLISDPETEEQSSSLHLQPTKRPATALVASITEKVRCSQSPEEMLVTRTIPNTVGENIRLLEMVEEEADIIFQEDTLVRVT